MKMYRKSLALVIALMMLVATMMTTVFAAHDAKTVVAYLKEKGINDILLSTHLTTKSDDAAKKEDGTEIVFTYEGITNLKANGANGTDASGDTIYVKNGSDLAKATKAFDSAVSSWKSSGGVGQIIDNLGVEGDVTSATQALQGFVPVVNWILGVVCVVITLGLGVFTAFDIAYIAFPVFQGRCNDAKMSGGRGTRPGANGEHTLILISDEAQHAVEESQKEGNKSPWSIYLGKRIWAYIAVSIAMFILLTGNIAIITNIAMKIVGFIMGVLASFA